MNFYDNESDAIRIARAIDHSALKPTTTQAEAEQLCKEALEYGFASVCVNPCHAARIAGLLSGSAVKSCSTVGFPLGATLAEVKKYETELLVSLGVREIDMVVNIASLKAGELSVLDEVVSICDIAHAGDAIVKVIIETTLLNEEEKIRACKIIALSGADFIKTSTGFSSGGTTIDDVKLLRSNSPRDIRIKASGGIRDAKFALALLNAGADRLGTSSGLAMMQELQSKD